MSVLQRYNSANINQLMERLQKNTIGMDDYFDRVFGVEAQSYPPYNLVQVNEDESQLEMALAGFTDQEVKAARFEGKNWADQVSEIIATLPRQVYLSFDIDGLNPSLCPNTGTPVPGGMELEEVVYLIDAVKASGRTLIGMDLVEVSPGEDEWDANVGARALYTLSNRLS